MNIEAQRIERELRSELEDVVTKDLHEAVLKRQRVLEESESKLKVEVMRLKEISEVASHQAEAVQAQQESRDKELTSLRKQLYDIQMENDDKTIIGMCMLDISVSCQMPMTRGFIRKPTVHHQLTLVQPNGI